MSNRSKLVTAGLALGIWIAATAAAAPADRRDGVEVVVLRDAVQLTVAGDEVSYLRLEVFDQARQRVFDSGPQEGPYLDWDLATESGERAAPGTYFYVVQAWGDDGRVVGSQVGQAKLAVEACDLQSCLAQ